MGSNCKGDMKNEDETRLAEKLSELEQKMKQLQSSLMDEKFKLNRERVAEGDELPDNWASMSRLHLPQCPLAKVSRTVGNRPPICALHGNPTNTTFSNDCPSTRNYQKSDDPSYIDYHHYTKMLSEAETLARADNINEKVRQLYESSIYSPTFYRPRDTMHSQQPRFETGLESQVIRFGQEPSISDDIGLNTKQKKYDSFEEISLVRNGSSTITEVGADDVHEDNLDKDLTPTSEDDSSIDVFNPYGAIENVRNKFLDIENYVFEASIKSKLKGAC